MPVKMVKAGSFYIGKRQMLTLEAILGTCVGLALVDRYNNVAGLYHILLPEPPDPETKYQCEVYASTGLPLFLKELKRRGAKPSQLEAFTAGGALVGPIMEGDLFINIGGETYDVVESFLQEQGIPIVFTESGGFFTCRMQLDMNSLGVTVEPFNDEQSISVENIVRPSHDDLVGVIYSLKPIPQVAIKILEMVRTGNYSFASISREIRKDQVITAKVLSFCQSPMFRFPCEIQSIDRALVVLGERRLLQAILIAYCGNLFQCPTGGYSMCRGGLFNHAVTTAHLAEALAKAVNLPQDQAYTAGLLHDIGKVVLDNYIHPVAPYFYRRVLTEGASLSGVEREVFGVTHSEAGKLLCNIWSLPLPIALSVECHEINQFENVDDVLTKIVGFANFLASRFLPGQSLSGGGLARIMSLESSIQQLDRPQLFGLLETASIVSRMITS